MSGQYRTRTAQPEQCDGGAYSGLSWKSEWPKGICDRPNARARVLGITPAQLADVELWEEPEREVRVVPVYLDELERPYILFSTRNFRTERYCLHENGGRLEGDIETNVESKDINVR